MKPLDFMAAKRARDVNNVYPGDFVIWKDYDDQTYTTRVLRMQKKIDNKESSILPLNEKDAYVLTLAQGLTIDGTIIIKKFIKK